jgi:glycosyltransferase involved in cell wall biosynthesis
VQLLHHINREKYQMDFLVHTEDPGAYDDEVRACGSRIFPCLRPTNPLQYAWNFHRILQEGGPYDCIHSHVHQFSGYLMFLAAQMKIPVRLVQSHSDTRFVDHQTSIPRSLYIHGMNHLIQRYATRGIAVSEHAAQSLFSESWRSDPRWSICPLGIDLSPFRQSIDCSVVRAELGIASGALVIGHVGRFQAPKNHRFLVEIATRLCQLERKAVFLLVGGGPFRSAIEAEVSKRRLQSHFVFAGLRSDVPRLMMGAMDCFLLPSSYEGLPLVLLEAQAAGLPCVISDAVSSEGDLDEESVTRLSLSLPIDAWVAHVLATRRTRILDSAHPWVNLRSLEASLARLECLYDSQVQGQEQIK